MSNEHKTEREPDDFIVENSVKNKQCIEFSFKPTFKSSNLSSFLGTFSVYFLERLIHLTVQHERFYVSLTISVIYKAIEETMSIGASPMFITRESDIERKIKEIFEELEVSLLQAGDNLEVKELEHLQLSILLHKPIRITPKGATLTWSSHPPKYKRARIIDYDIAIDGSIVTTCQPTPSPPTQISYTVHNGASAADTLSI